MVRSELRGGKGEVITLDYRMVLDNDDWYILDINVMGLWLVESYRTQFASVVNQTGLPGLIDALARLNGSR
jgi:phospholipid transport system substrate-binding protein